MSVAMRRITSQRSWRIALAAVVLACFTVASRAEMPIYKLSLAPDDESVYAPPTAPREDQGVNLGGVNLDLKFTYLSAYVYRGVDHSNFVNNKKERPNLQFEGTVFFNTGKLPHPFIGIFTNVNNGDPVSRFQEIRPYGGVEWTLRPFTIDAGVNSYIYPEREKFNTAEAWAKITFDDSILFRSERPLFSPYIYGAYDYVLNNGTYLEAGIKHDFVIEDTGITVTVLGDIAYVNNIKQVFIFTNKGANGLQHYDVGLIATYSLNRLFHFSKRYGDVSLNGYINYTDGISRDVLHADTKIWGGVGLQFKY
jgi:hypothetical protein